MSTIYRGSHGMMWLNNAKQTTVTEVEAKASIEYEDWQPIGQFTAEKEYKGFSGSGKFVRKKTNSDLLVMIADAITTGEMPDVKIITNMEVGGKNERIAISGITFTEVTLISIKGQDSVDEEIPFDFANFEILETI